MHTREQARELWCPLVRYACGSEPPAYNRCDDSDYRSISNPSACRCIASDCMMWRWGRLNGEGYCGLGGGEAVNRAERRRRAAAARGGGERSPEQIADYALRGANSRHVVVGPLLWQSTDGTANKRWYFMLASSGEGRGFRCDMVTVTPDEREKMRASVIMALIERRPLVIHDVGDEVTMARLCETLWPGPRITRLREGVEAEYASREKS
jgi:hypothetical protein